MSRTVVPAAFKRTVSLGRAQELKIIIDGFYKGYRENSSGKSKASTQALEDINQVTRKPSPHDDDTLDDWEVLEDEQQEGLQK